MTQVLGITKFVENIPTDVGNRVRFCEYHKVCEQYNKCRYLPTGFEVGEVLEMVSVDVTNTCK